MSHNWVVQVNDDNGRIVWMKVFDSESQAEAAYQKAKQHGVAAYKWEM